MQKCSRLLSVAVATTLLAFATGAGADEVTFVARPAGQPNAHYAGNRAPLAPSPFVRLPIKSVQPEGWLRKQLELSRDGFTGHLPEISRFLKKDNNSWLKPRGDQAVGWEEVPYWLRGFGDLAYVLRDEKLTAEAKTWIEAAIASQQPDGYFGPERNRHAPAGFDRTVGKSDLWSNMVMTDCLISWYDYTGDPRVPALLTRYFAWANAIPDADFLTPYWQQQRGGDLLAQVIWLYNITGDASLVDFARKVHRHTINWTDGVPDDHNVNMAMAFREPATFWMLSGDRKHLDATYRDYDRMMSDWGQFPGGGIAGDERVRKGYTDPRQMFETCGMVEFMHSHELLTRFTGDPVWADRCEDMAFNSFPASMTADAKALRYLTAPNLVVSDATDRAGSLYNGGPMTLMDPLDHRCCQHNSGFGWPYFARNLYLATPDNGLAAVLYADSTLTAKAGDGADVTLRQQTGYPFDETIHLTVDPSRPTAFPLYLRVPAWCDAPELSINGSRTPISPDQTASTRADSIAPSGSSRVPPSDTPAAPASHGRYLKVSRQWKQGDRVELKLPMPVRVQRWAANKNSASVYRGPLAFSVEIKERYNRTRPGPWPAYEILPDSPWNYGLLLDESVPAADQFKVERRPFPASAQPWTVADVPVVLTTKARRIPNWQLDENQMPGQLQPSPTRSAEPVETLRLIPMGAARIRMTSLPVVGDGPDAREWPKPQSPTASAALQSPLGAHTATASHCYAGDTVAALWDNVDPARSVSPRFTWWPIKGRTQWVQYDLAAPTAITGLRVFWFDDEPNGGCRVPQSWRLLRLDGDQWKPVDGIAAYPVAKGQFTELHFPPTTAKAFRLEAQLKHGYSSGVLEWQLLKE
jgi:DUF1680 family protein